MKIFMTLLSFAVFTTNAVAASATNGYDIKAEFTLDGKHVASPHLQGKEGQRVSSIYESPEGKFAVAVVAKNGDSLRKNTVMMQFTVSKVEANGTEIIIASPQLLSPENAPTTIKEAKPDGTQSVSLKVIVKKVSL